MLQHNKDWQQYDCEQAVFIDKETTTLYLVQYKALCDNNAPCDYIQLTITAGINMVFSGKFQSSGWRQSLAALLCIVLCFAVLLSVCCIGVYLIKDKPVYEELVDYLDKSIAISKINYNHQLGFFELEEQELQALEEHRTVSFFLGAENQTHFIQAGTQIWASRIT